MHRALTCLGVFVLAIAATAAATPQLTIVDPMPAGAPRDAANTREIPIGTGEISGVVTAAATGRPLANVRLNLSGSVRTTTTNTPGPGLVTTLVGTGTPLSRTTVSDDQGRFVFDALPAGGFILTGMKEQYLTSSYGARQPGKPGTIIPLTDGQRSSASLALSRGGVISGTVYTQDGEGLQGAQVQAFRVAYANGVRRPQRVGWTMTDDRGTYRLANLLPGEYFVSALPSPVMSAELGRAEDELFHAALRAARQAGRTPRSVTVPASPGRIEPPDGFVPTYHPSALSFSSAMGTTLAAGDERSSFDVTMLGIRGSTITGVVAGAPSNAAVQVSIVNDDPLEDSARPFTTRASSDGSFTLRNFVPGQYTISAQIVPGPVVTNLGGGRQTITQPKEVDPASRMWAAASLSVGGQTSPRVVLTMQPPRTVSGMVQFDASVQRRANLSIMLGASPVSRVTALMGPQPQSPVAADGTFTISGVLAGTYVIRASSSMESALLNGQDLLDFPLVIEGDRDVSGIVITIGDRRGELSGRLTDATGSGAPDYTIVAAAADRRYWLPGSRRIVTARPDLNGRYMLNGLPAGDYLVAAVTELETGQQFDPEFLDGLAKAAVRVTIARGGRQTQDLRIAR